MSKWFRSRLDEDDDDDESEDESSSEDEEEEESESEESDRVEEESGPRRSRFHKGAVKDDDSGDETSGRKVISQREKRSLETQEVIQSLTALFKMEYSSDAKADVKGDYTQVQETFERLAKVADKAPAPLPKVIRKALNAVDNFVREQEEDREEIKKMGQQQVKAFAILKQKVRKTMAKFGVGEEDDADDILSHADSRDKHRAEELEKDWKPELIERKISEVLVSRGRKADRKTFVYQLQNILAHTSYPHLQVQLLVYLVAGYLDAAIPTASHVKLRQWKYAQGYFIKLLVLLAENTHIILTEAEDEYKESQPVTKDDNIIRITIEGNLMSFTERLDDEFTRALQFIDPHTREFLQWLSLELSIVDTCERVLSYYRQRELNKHAARLSSRLMDHLYYRRQAEHVKMLARQRMLNDDKSKVKGKKKSEEQDEQTVLQNNDNAIESQKEGKVPKGKASYTSWWFITSNLTETVQKLSSVIVKYGDEKARARSLLCRVFHLALHDNYFQARDMVLMSHIHDVVGAASPQFQIIFNRVLAQLGLAAFRLGRWHDVHVALNDLCASQKHKELLAQGLPMRYDRKVENEAQERQKLVPYHMHINLEVLEACHLVAAMLLEVPLMAANPFDIHRKVQSKAFQRLLNHYQALYFLGPPENTRDHVYAATTALLKGDWVTAVPLIVDLPVWDSIPSSEKVRDNLRRSIKDVALRSYLLQYAPLYSNLSLETLSQKFDINPTQVHSVVSKMVFNDDLAGSWDEPARCLRMNPNHPTKLQHLCLMLADKAQSLVENNERVLDARSGGFGGVFKSNADKQPNRPTESLWSNLNRWAVFGGNSGGGGQNNQQGGGMARRYNNQNNNNNRQGFIQQNRRNYGIMQNRQSQGNRYY
jgi:translation initiation factor 3 subunit C